VIIQDVVARAYDDPLSLHAYLSPAPVSVVAFSPVMIIIGQSNPTFPAPGHVRTPDTYGPTGTEFAGTETEPGQGDVRNGVQYGADGTEFTGTYVAGGAAGMSRGRVVN
jgi:hypothetical protein